MAEAMKIQLAEPRTDLTGLQYEFHVIPVGGQAVGKMDCRPGTRIHSVVPLPRGAIAGSPLQMLVVIEVERRN